MRIKVLGSAAGGGFPQWNCNCRNCDGVRKGAIAARPRTQSSIAVTVDGVNWVLFNASPDILQQTESVPGSAAGARYPRHGDRRDRSGRRADRPHHRPADAARGQASAADLVHGHGSRGSDHRQPAVPHPRTLLRRRAAPTDPGAAFTFTVPGADGLRSGVPLKSKAPPYSPHRDNPHDGDNIGVRITDTRSGRSAVLRARAGRDRAARRAADGAGRLRDGRRHVLDRRRDDRASASRRSTRARSGTCRSPARAA